MLFLIKLPLVITQTLWGFLDSLLSFCHLPHYKSLIQSWSYPENQGLNPCWNHSAFVIRAYWALSGLKFWLWNYGHRKMKMIFDSVVTVFFRLQRKLKEEKKALLEFLPWGNSSSYTSWPELSGSLILSRPSLISETEKKKWEFVLIIF